MLEKHFMKILHAFLVSAVIFPTIQTSPVPVDDIQADIQADIQTDRATRGLPSNNRKNVNQIETSDSKVHNYTGSVPGSEEFTSWHQERRNISSGGGDFSELDDNNKAINATVPGSTDTKSENSTCTLEPAYLCFTDPIHSQRNKEARLNAIKDYVMRSLLGVRERPPSRNPNKGLSSPFSGQLQTFYASCDSPTNVDLDTWTSPSFFHIFFNVTSTSVTPPETPQVSQNRSAMASHEYVPVSNAANITPILPKTQQTVNIISAKLKLYKTGNVNENQVEIPKYEAPSNSEPCNDTEVSQELSPTIIPTSVELPIQGLPVPDERIRVTVYWYTTPLTKNHFKRKLLDTKMMSVKDTKWVDFDIQKAAKAWLVDKKVNYGLVVEVQNEDDDIVDARKYFSNLPCSLISAMRTNNNNNNETQAPTEQSTDEEGLNVNDTPAPVAAQTIEILPPPVVEICTLTVPNTPRSNEFEPTSFFPFPFSMGPSGYPVPVPTTSHKQPVPHQPHDLWQNDDLSTATNNSHHHRHNHGKNKNRHHHKKNNSSRNNPAYKLDDDHPLRQILATAPSSMNSRENRRNVHHSHSSNSNSNTRVEKLASEDETLRDYIDDEVDVNESSGKDREIIIQKIYITPPRVNSNSNAEDDEEKSSEKLNRAFETPDSKTANNSV